MPPIDNPVKTLDKIIVITNLQILFLGYFYGFFRQQQQQKHVIINVNKLSKLILR